MSRKLAHAARLVAICTALLALALPEPVLAGSSERSSTTAATKTGSKSSKKSRRRKCATKKKATKKAKRHSTRSSRAKACKTRKKKSSSRSCSTKKKRATKKGATKGKGKRRPSRAKACKARPKKQRDQAPAVSPEKQPVKPSRAGSTPSPAPTAPRAPAPTVAPAPAPKAAGAPAPAAAPAPAPTVAPAPAPKAAGAPAPKAAPAPAPKAAPAPAPTPTPTIGVFVSLSGSDTTGSGTIARPYRTLDKAAAAARPGDTVYVRAGSYGKTTITRSGTSTARITFKPYPGEKVVIDGSGTTEQGSAMALWNSSFVVVEGFEVKNGTGRGISVMDSSSVVVRNNTVHDTWTHPIMGSGDSLTFEGNVIYNTILKNRNGALGTAYWPGTISTWSRSSGAYSTNIVIRNNQIRDSWGEGILPTRSNGVIIADNTVHDTWSVNIYLTEVSHAVVERNNLYSTATAFNRNGRAADGILIGNEGSGTGGTPSSPYSSDLLIQKNTITRTGYGIRFWYDSSRATNNSYRTIRILSNVIRDTVQANIHFMDVPTTQTQPTGNVLRDNFLTGAVFLADSAGWSR